MSESCADNEIRAVSTYRTLRHQQEVHTRETDLSVPPCRIVGAAWAPPRAEENLRLCSNESRKRLFSVSEIAKLLLRILTRPQWQKEAPCAKERFHEVPTDQLSTTDEHGRLEWYSSKV